MTGRLRRPRNSPPEYGIYEISGSLDGVRPGRRFVQYLTIRRFDRGTSEGLAPLAQFADLRHLTLTRASGVDLTPLAGLPIESLRMNEIEKIDLAPLAELPALRDLGILDLGPSRVPARLALPGTLRSLSLINDATHLTGEPIKALIDAIDWTNLDSLELLRIRIGGLYQLEPIRVDLSWLRHLTSLQLLDLSPGVWPATDGPSPLDPPFEGLPTSLQQISIDAAEPDALRPALEAHIAGGATVNQRVEPQPQPPWSLTAPGDGESEWSALGSLADAPSLGDHDTEVSALRAARRRLREVDPALLRRLDFDEDSSSTLIIASSRGDLVVALTALELVE